MKCYSCANVIANDENEMLNEKHGSANLWKQVLAEWKHMHGNNINDEKVVNT